MPKLPSIWQDVPSTKLVSLWALLLSRWFHRQLATTALEQPSACQTSLEGMPCDDAKAWFFVMFNDKVKGRALNRVRSLSFDGIGLAPPKAECMLPMRMARKVSLCLTRGSNDKFCYGIMWGMTISRGGGGGMAIFVMEALRRRKDHPVAP